jgi:hypothetical protein
MQGTEYESPVTLGGSGACSPEKILKFEPWKCYFLRFQPWIRPTTLVQQI